MRSCLVAVYFGALLAAAIPVAARNLLVERHGLPPRAAMALLAGPALALTALTWLAARRLDRRSTRARLDRATRASLAEIDAMTGIEFEDLLQELLEARGYEVQRTPASGDLGVDLIAQRGGESIAIQAKRRAGKVDRRAVSDAVAGMRHYGCSAAMVITNGRFTPDAERLAASNHCRLVDRRLLANWLREARGGGGRNRRR